MPSLENRRIIYYEGDSPDLAISDGWLQFYDDDRKWQPLVDLTLHLDILNKANKHIPEGNIDKTTKSILLAIIYSHCVCGETYKSPNPHLLERRGVSHFIPTDILLPHDLDNKIMTDELPREIIHIHQDVASCQKCFEEFDGKQLDFFRPSARPSLGTFPLGIEDEHTPPTSKKKDSSVSLKDFF